MDRFIIKSNIALTLLGLLVSVFILILPHVTHASLTDGLVGHWTFDGKDTTWTSSTTGTTRDLSGNGNAGTMTNMNRATAPKMGKIGQGINLGGDVVNGKYIDFGSALSLDNIETQTGNGMTVSAWINPRSTGGYSVGTIVGKATDPDVGGGHWSFGMSSNRLKFEKGYSTALLSVISSEGSVKLSKWQHVLVTWDGSENASNVHMYIDGVESGYVIRQSGVGTKGTDAPTNLLVGGPNRFFDGTLDDVRIYNRALSSTEIQQLYKLGGGKTGVTPSRTNATSTGTVGLGAGLVGHWTFDGKDTTWTSSTTGTTRDLSGSGNTGTMTNMNRATAPKAGKIGQGINFNGTNQYITTPDNDLFTFSDGSNDTAFSVSAWVYYVSGGGNDNSASIVNKYDSYLPFSGEWGFFINSQDKIQFQTLDSAPTVRCNRTSNKGIPKNKWVHTVAIYDGSGRDSGILLYVDGTLTPSTGLGQDGSYVTMRNRTSPVTVGASLYSGSLSYSSFLNGKVDDVRIYNRALSATEIQQLYKVGQRRVR